MMKHKIAGGEMTKSNATEHPRGWRGRAVGALGVLAIAGSALITGPAAAQEETMACNYPPGSNTCLTIKRNPNIGSDCVLHVGIDVQMTRRIAQDIIDANGGRPFGVQLMAHDHDNPDADTTGLVELTDMIVLVAGEQGLGAEFIGGISTARLDEDRGNERDEVYVRVELFDPSFGPQPRRFRSGIITGDGRRCFLRPSGGSGGCGGSKPC